MNHKYFTWINDEGYYRGQDLLSVDQIISLLRYHNYSQEIHATIIDYDMNAKAIGCPLYFDIDCPDLIEAWGQMRNLVDDLLIDYNIEPRVYFSGSKGFHVLMPLYIEHPRCHEIARMIAEEYGTEIDTQVYRERAMMRMPTSINTKTGLYKVEVIPSDSLTCILERAKSKGMMKPFTYSTSELFKSKVQECIADLPDVNKRRELIIGGDFEADMTPCMRTLWEMKRPPQGQSNQFFHVMARHCFKCGLSIDDAIATFNAKKYWQFFEPRDYEKVIGSVYTSGKAMIGCYSGRDKDLLTKYCDSLCKFNRETNVNSFINFN
jgi:hypothetical protein